MAIDPSLIRFIELVPSGRAAFDYRGMEIVTAYDPGGGDGEMVWVESQVERMWNNLTAHERLACIARASRAAPKPESGQQFPHSGPQNKRS